MRHLIVYQYFIDLLQALEVFLLSRISCPRIQEGEIQVYVMSNVLSGCHWAALRLKALRISSLVEVGEISMNS